MYIYTYIYIYIYINVYTAALPVAVAGEVDEVKDDSQELSKKNNSNVSAVSYLLYTATIYTDFRDIFFFAGGHRLSHV